MKQHKTKNKGFTLIELIIVVAVLAILVGILAPSYTKYVKKSKVAKCEAQREAIERAYQLAAMEHSELAACKDTIELGYTIGGENLITYLQKNGYLDNGKTECPVYKKPYSIELVSSNNNAAIEVICDCVDNVSGYLGTAVEFFKGNMGKDREIIEKVYEERGSLLKVSDNMKQGSLYSDKELYWRPYSIPGMPDGKNVVLYATTGNDSSWGQWRAALLYIDGKIYQSKNGVNNKPPGVQMNTLHSVKESDLETWLEKNSFECLS